MDINDNATSGTSTAVEQGLNGNQLYPKVDNMDPVIGHKSDQSENSKIKQPAPKNEANFNIHDEDRPILNGVVLSPEENKEMRITDVKLETLKNKTTWQEMSPKRERKIARQNSSGSIKSSSSGSASGSSGSSEYSSCSPPGSPTKSWKSIRESNKNNALSWKELSGNKFGKSPEEPGTSANENQFGKCVCSPEHRASENVRNQTSCDTDNACITRTRLTDNGKMETGHLTSCVHTTDNGQNPACNCKSNGGGRSGRSGQNVNKNQGSPEHRGGAPSEEQSNEYFYDEDFTVQFDTNLRESSPGLNCTCIDPTIVGDFPNIVTGSYLSFNNMKGSGVFLDPHSNVELFCPDESELSSCRNSAMDLSSSEREMMCSSDMLEFSDNPLFTPSPTKELEKQNVSTDSLDRNNFRPGEHCCQDGSLESSDGNLCVNCCPKKEDYFLSFDGSQGRSQTNSENENSLISIGSGHGHWGQTSSGEEMVSEECTDSFHFCYMNGNGNIQHGHRRIKFQALKAVHEDHDRDDAADADDSEGKLSLPKITRSPISEFNHKINGGSNGKRGCCHGKKSQGNKLGGLSPAKSPMRHTIPNRKVTSWKQVKSLKSLGKMDMEANRSSSMPELYVETWQSVTSQDCRDIAKIAESFHGKRHSAYLLDLYQRVRNQSNPVSPETMANIEQILFHPLISQNRCHGEANLSAPIGPCGVCGRDGSHSSHTLTNSNIQHLVNTSRSGQQLDPYTRKRIIEWLEKDRLDAHCKAKGSQTERELRTVETVISPTTVTLWCGTKNFGAQFPPHTRDCGIQTAANNVRKDGRVYHVEQQTSPTLEREHRKQHTAEAAQQTSPNSEKHEILSMLPEKFLDLEDILPRKEQRSPNVPRSKSADANVHKNTMEAPHGGCFSYYTYKSLPDLNFIFSPDDHVEEEEISLFDPLPVSIPIPILTPTFAKSYSGAPTTKKENQSGGTSSKRSVSVPAKLVNQLLLRNGGETGSNVSGVSTSSTSSGIDPGYSTDERPFSVGSPSNDIERLLFYPPHVENSAKKERGQGQMEGQGQNKSNSHPNLRRVSENLVNRYANEAHPISLDTVTKPRLNEANTVDNSDGKVLANPAVEQLYSLQEENTPLSSPDVSRCHHNCCHGEDCFFVNHPNQFSSESSSSKESGNPKSNRKPLKSCLRKQHFLRSRSLSDPHNLAQTADSQKKKLNRHSYACEEVYLLTDDSGQYYLCQSDNSSQSNDSTGPVLFYLDNVVPADGTQTVKLRRTNPAESGTRPETGTRPVAETADTLNGKRKSVSFASEVSFHDISPHASPKHRGEGTESETTKELPVLARANSTESYESSDSDGPPDSFKLSPPPEQNVYAQRFDELERKRGMLMEVCQVAEIILHHFSKAKNPFDKLRLGSSADTSEIGDLVMSRLCPVLNRVVGDGLKPFLNGFQMFGRVNVTVWKVAEISAEQGPYTRAIHDLVQQLKSNPGLTSCSAKFEAFLFGLLNLRLLDYWMGYLRYSDNLTDKFYNSDGVIVLSRTCHERAYDEMLISLQPLSVLPFQLGLEYVLENSKYLSHSPTVSPNRSKSPLISPSLERNVGLPPPKPARSLNGTGLISAKAWEWIKGSVCDEGADQKLDSGVVGKKEEVPAANRGDGFGERRSKSLDDVQGGRTQTSRDGEMKRVVSGDVQDGRLQKSRDREVRRTVSGDHQGNVDLKGMTDSFSGIAQKLLGMNTSREKSPEDGRTKNPEKNLVKDKTTAQEPVESVSSKAKSGILKFFDKLLLSKDAGPAPKSQIPKRYSWNVPNEGQRSPDQRSEGQRSPGCKSLSPVSGNKELRNSLEYQKQKFANARKNPKSKSDNVVARSIQSEATKDIESEAEKFNPKEASKEDRKAGAEKLGEKSSSGRVRKNPEKIDAVTEKPLSKQARNPPSNLNLKLRNVEEAQDRVSVKVTGSPSKKFGSPQRKAADKVKVGDKMKVTDDKAKVGDKAKVSKIPTLQKKIENKRPQRNSLVLDSSGYSSSSMLSSPTRVKHSYSAGQIPVPVHSPKKNKVSCSKNTEIPTDNKKEPNLRTVAPGGVGVQSSAEFPINDPSASVESTSSNESASLEIGPTLIAPASPTRKIDACASQKLTAEKSQNKTTPPVTGAQPQDPPVTGALPQDLDINSNSPLPARADQAAGVGSRTTDQNRDFMKPDFRCIETITDFESGEVSQLSYKKGEHFEVLAEIDSSWFYCVNGPQEGLIHVNAVKPLSDKDEFHLLHNNFYS